MMVTAGGPAWPSRSRAGEVEGAEGAEGAQAGEGGGAHAHAVAQHQRLETGAASESPADSLVSVETVALTDQYM